MVGSRRQISRGPRGANEEAVPPSHDQTTKFDLQHAKVLQRQACAREITGVERLGQPCSEQDAPSSGNKKTSPSLDFGNDPPPACSGVPGGRSFLRRPTAEPCSLEYLVGQYKTSETHLSPSACATPKKRKRENQDRDKQYGYAYTKFIARNTRERSVFYDV